jgi:hypothetical protein
MSMRLGMKCIVLILVLSTGCEKKLSESERIRKVAEATKKKAVPVEGTVLVDGRPQENVLVSLYKPDSAKPVPPNVLVPVGPVGKIAFSTYENGDGLLPGNYKLVFEWHKIKFRRSKQTIFDGPDKLNGRYSNPTKSEFLVQVVESQPQKDLKFELKSK